MFRFFLRVQGFNGILNAASINYQLFFDVGNQLTHIGTAILPTRLDRVTAAHVSYGLLCFWVYKLYFVHIASLTGFVGVYR